MQLTDGGNEAVSEENRLKLRAVFDKFDADGSGSVSCSEMSAMLAQLELQKSDEEVAALVREADPDGSGEIDFDEFVHVLGSQLAGGGLAEVVTKAGALFGWLNPLSWLGK